MNGLCCMSTALDWINHWAKKKPAKAALIYRGAPISYSYLAHVVETVRRFLEARLPVLDPGSGERPTAVLAISSLADAWVVTLAARALGMDTLSLPRPDHPLVESVKSVACLIVMEGEKVRLAPDTAHADKLIAIPASIFGAQHLLTIKKVEADLQGGNFLLSSGATGMPKRVLLSAQVENEVADIYAKHALLTASSRAYLVDYTLAASGGYMYGIACFKLGATFIIDGKIDFLKTFYEADFDYVTLRPSHIDTLHASATLQPPVAKPRMRLHIGGGFMNFGKIEWVLKNITSNVFQIYSATENGALTKTKVTNAEDLLWHSVHPHRRIEIVDEAGNSVPDGTEGILRVRQESYTAKRYHDDPVATAAHFRDGYFYPGDLAMRRADGRVRVLGRVADVLFIKSDRFPVGPVEAEIQQIAGCLDACVFARQNALTQTEILIALEADAAPAPERVQKLKAMFTTVDAVHVSAYTAFPKTTGGKTDRAALRERLIAERETETS
ncbi:MAG: hypothetical protein JWN07_985 [Hyphomicrobiales bacterium]|nr:hypothetical protein [Hyphomicrobiales bacterium]